MLRGLKGVTGMRIERGSRMPRFFFQSGRPGWLFTSAPHRSGRAGLPHPALRIAGLLRCGVSSCSGWLGPLHFSRFHPLAKLTHLPPTLVNTLLKARDIARNAGLRYVYIGNVREVSDAGTTTCPTCKRAIIERDIFAPHAMSVKNEMGAHCRAKIAGVWKARRNSHSTPASKVQLRRIQERSWSMRDSKADLNST
jgi:hypothetical protein